MESGYERNRRAWDGWSDEYQARHGAQLAANPEAWGVWSLPETELRLVGDVAGLEVLEYGCGAAQWSIALARRGGRLTGLDNSARQLEHARTAVAAAGVEVRLVHAPAERTPFADASFDLVFCDHGGLTFAPPEVTIPEVARILRPGGSLAFSVEHPLHAVCWDDTADAPSNVLHHSYFELDNHADTDGPVSFVRPIAAYVALLHDHGFVLERLLEPRPPAEARTTYKDFAGLAWGRHYPAELMIRARSGEKHGHGI